MKMMRRMKMRKKIMMIKKMKNDDEDLRRNKATLNDLQENLLSC